MINRISALMVIFGSGMIAKGLMFEKNYKTYKEYGVWGSIVNLMGLVLLIAGMI